MSNVSKTNNKHIPTQEPTETQDPTAVPTEHIVAYAACKLVQEMNSATSQVITMVASDKMSYNTIRD